MYSLLVEDETEPKPIFIALFETMEEAGQYVRENKDRFYEGHFWLLQDYNLQYYVYTELKGWVRIISDRKLRLNLLGLI